MSHRSAASWRQCWEGRRRFPELMARDVPSERMGGWRAVQNGQGWQQALGPARNLDVVLWEVEVGRVLVMRLDLCFVDHRVRTEISTYRETS